MKSKTKIWTVPLTVVIVVVGLLLTANFFENQPNPPLLSIKETPLVVVDRVFYDPMIPQVSGNSIKLQQVIENNFRRLEKEVIIEINKFRQQNNLATLSVNQLLVNTAKKKGEFLIEHNLFSHSAGDISLDEWFKEYFASKTIKDTNGMMVGEGENLAKGFKSAKEVVDAWIASKGHRDNILNDHFNEIGVFVGVNKRGEMITVLHLGGTFPAKEALPLSVYYPLSSVVARAGEEFSPQVEVESQIRKIARQEGFEDAGLLVRLADCESKLDPTAKGDGGDSVGLFQINSRWHKQSEEDRMDIRKSTLWTIDQIRQSNLGIWSCASKI